MGWQMSLQTRQQRGTAAWDSRRLLSPCEQGHVSGEGGELTLSSSPPPTPPVRQVLAPSVPTSKLLIFSLLVTATSSPVSVGVINRHHVGNMQCKY